MDAGNETQTFLGASAVEAMEKVKAELGEDAVLVSQRTVTTILAAPPPGQAGQPARFQGATVEEAQAAAREALGAEAVLLGEREAVELTASAAAPAPPRGPEAAAPRPPRVGGTLLQRAYGTGDAAWTAAGQPPAAGAPAGGPAPTASAPAAAAPGAGGSVPVGSDVLADIQARLGELERLARRSDRPAVPESLIDLYLNLLDDEVTEELARHLVERLHEELPPDALRDRERVREAMLKAVARLIPAQGGIRLREDGGPTVVAVVGPTGVGKTTSVAKLATQFRVHERRQVMLITEDTTRPGGAEQLRSVAQLLSIPLVVADTVDRLSAAVRRGQDCDVILVDTAGRVPRNETTMEELSTVLDAIDPDEVHLALCCLTGTRNVLDAIRRFEAVDFDRLLLTKLDEATSYGLILNVAAQVDRGLGYVTTGQDYMENIQAGDAERLADLILNGSAR